MFSAEMLRANILSGANSKFWRHTAFKKQLVCFSFSSQTLKGFLQMDGPVADVSVHTWLGLSAW